MIKFIVEIFLIFILTVSFAELNQEAIHNLAYQGYSPYLSGHNGYCRTNLNCLRGFVCNLFEYKCKCPNGQQL